MEIGQKHSVKTTNTNKIFKKLSIQVNLNGLSFCILDTYQNQITHYLHIPFEAKATPTSLLDKLGSAFNKHELLQDNFESVTIIHDNELATLVPNSLFSEEHLADYLKFNSAILQTDYIAHDAIDELHLKNVYIPFININNYIFDQFGAFEYHHSNTLLLKRLLPVMMRADELLVAYVSRHHFEILSFKDKNPQLINRFEYHSKEDFIYYLLFTMEQLQLDTETTEVGILGIEDEQHPLFEIAYTYIRNVSLLQQNLRYKLAEEVAKENPEYTLINSF